MIVRLITLRERGRRTRRAEGSEGVVGELQVSATMHGTELHRVARLCGRRELSAHLEDLVPPLYQPELVAVSRDALLLRGFEADGDAAHVQEWHCRLVPQASGDT